MEINSVKDNSGQEAVFGTFKSYLTGFLLSMILTLAAYLLVINQVISGWVLVATIIVLGVVQLVVQLLFFLHLSQESKPRWNLLVLAFAVLVVLIVVVGSLWIMSNLNYHQMSPQELNSTILHDEGIKK